MPADGICFAAQQVKKNRVHAGVHKALHVGADIGPGTAHDQFVDRLFGDGGNRATAIAMIPGVTT